MNLKTKIKMYRIVIEEVTKEYKETGEFIPNKINELCSGHGISRRYVYRFVMLCKQFRANLFSLSL